MSIPPDTKLILLNKVLELADGVLTARRRDERIRKASMLVSLAEALGVRRDAKVDALTVDVHREVLEALGVPVDRVIETAKQSLAEVLRYRWHSDVEVDLFVKALVVQAAVVEASARYASQYRVLE
jgi:hypothetical protein